MVNVANDNLVKKQKKFILIDEHIEIFKGLTLYFLGDNSVYDTSKGIFLGGDVGTGKTFMLMLMNYLLPIKDRFKTLNAANLSLEYQRQGTDFLTQYESGNIFIDDIGTEEIRKNYGTELNVVEYLTSVRYDKWHNLGTKTHFTSNIADDKIINFYGNRIYSRMMDMCNFIPMTGNDRRLT